MLVLLIPYLLRSRGRPPEGVKSHIGVYGTPRCAKERREQSATQKQAEKLVEEGRRGEEERMLKKEKQSVLSFGIFPMPDLMSLAF